MIKTQIIYNHRGRFGKDGTAPIEVRVTIGRRAYYINTGVSVRAREWKFGQIVNRVDCDTLNERVEIMLQRVDEIINERMKHKAESEIDFDEVRKLVKSPDKRRRTADANDMAEWMKEQIDLLDIAIGTKKHYRISVAAMVESGMRRWGDLSVEKIHRFDAFLHNMQKHRTDAEIKAKKPVKYIEQATVRNYHKDIKALLGRAVKFGMITANPYDRMKGEIKRGDHETVEFLTAAERERIEQLPMTEGTMLATVRDIFIFQCYTGMAYSDMQAFSLDKCQEVGENLTYSAPRVKTGVVFYIRLLPQAISIAEKYGGRLPKVSDQVCNSNLKTIAQVAGITKKLTTHVGRHTFATWMLANGVPIERVSKMLGHRKVTQTQRYAKVMAMDVYGEFDKVEPKAKTVPINKEALLMLAKLPELSEDVLMELIKRKRNAAKSRNV